MWSAGESLEVHKLKIDSSAASHTSALLVLRRLHIGSGAADLCQRVRCVAGQVHHQAGLRRQPGVSGSGGFRVYRYLSMRLSFHPVLQDATLLL